MWPFVSLGAGFDASKPTPGSVSCFAYCPWIRAQIAQLLSWHHACHTPCHDNNGLNFSNCCKWLSFREIYWPMPFWFLEFMLRNFPLFCLVAFVYNFVLLSCSFQYSVFVLYPCCFNCKMPCGGSFLGSIWCSNTSHAWWPSDCLLHLKSFARFIKNVF